MRALGRAHRAAGSPTQVRVHGVGLRRPEGAPRRRSTWATPAPPCGCSRACSPAQSFDSTPDRRCLPHAAARWSAWRAAARDGRGRAHPRRQAAGRDPPAAGAARHRLPHAGGERTGEVGDAARRLVRRGRHARDRARAVAAITASACWPRCGVRVASEGATPRSSRRPAARRQPRSRCRGISPPPRSSSWRGCWRRVPRAGCCRTWAQSDPHRAARYPARMGADIACIRGRARERRRAGGRSAGAARAAARASTVPDGAGAARHR